MDGFPEHGTALELEKHVLGIDGAGGYARGQIRSDRLELSM